jgi:hypothetical protein
MRELIKLRGVYPFMDLIPLPAGLEAGLGGAENDIE